MTTAVSANHVTTSPSALQKSGPSYGSSSSNVSKVKKRRTSLTSSRYYMSCGIKSLATAKAIVIETTVPADRMVVFAPLLVNVRPEKALAQTYSH